MFLVLSQEQWQEPNNRMHLTEFRWRSNQQVMSPPSRRPEKDESMEKPKVVCLCGSTRFGDAFAKANCDETLAGRIVLTIGCNMKSNAELFGNMSDAEVKEIKTKLDELHKRKIDLADEILVLNVDGYIGDSTRSEIAYALAHAKSVRWLEPAAAEQITPADA